LSRSSSLFPAYLALLAVCFFWGTTYLAIRMALESFPPWTLVSWRYLLSGAILLAASAYRGAHLPRGRELWLTALYGVIVLAIGNGCLVFAETMIPSGLAALFITTSPFWMVGIESLVPGGARLHPPSIAGMVIGFLGAALLVTPGTGGQGFSTATLHAFALLQLGCLGWSLGSILQRRQPTRAHPVVSGAVQQLATGVVLLLPALAMPQHPVRWSWRGVIALAWLVVFGSIVGYSAYIYVMEHLPVALVSIYNYVNPVVAVLLGYLFYREPFGWREAMAMAIIFAGVALVKRFTKHDISNPAAAPEEVVAAPN
jgi:drug/metabolite transporter (DMT)-like permease